MRPVHEAISVITSCVVTTHAAMNIIENRPLPVASISPSSGSMAALAKLELIADFPPLTHADVLACLSFAAERERRLMALPAA